ncbi:hypothetical protein LAZ67_10001734 [Cordylochernes scorpioides]|uniref:Reverse transcriptase domain-containing protein n=1 Tax=Cordylochernes scorpioides TaxID=51811 RepID=A0ABY6KW30_9ARAC|nr:hypothetical protein LAZ67_10001734 [Cordylochernes scorpioides]
MRKGLRQGCACSAALFSIFTGPLLRHLERALGRGNVLAYADDIFLLIREDWQFEKVKTIFEEFRRASGVCVNFTKSKGLWCGAWRDRADSPLGISWSSSSITVLGCEVTSGQGTSVHENHLLGILERAISRWSPYVRGFSLVGRARAANSLVLAAVLHHLHGYLPCDATIAKLQARLTRFVWGSCYRAAWLPGTVLACPLACFKGVQTAHRVGSRNAYSWLVESGVWMAPMSSGAWLPPRRRRLLELWKKASPMLGLNHRVVPTPTLLNLPLVVRVRDLAGPAPSLTTRVTRNTCDDAAAHVPFCRRLVAENAGSSHQERSLEEAVVLRGTATPFLRISTRTARRMLECSRLAPVPISRHLRRWAPVVDVPSISLTFSSLRRCSFGGHAADITLRLALHALPHPRHPASSHPVCIACGSSDLSLAHSYWSCSAVRPFIRESFSIIGRPPDLQSWIFAVGLKDDAITISSAAKHAIYQATSHTKTQQGARVPDHQAEAGHLPSKVGSGAGGPVSELEFCPDFTQEEYFRALETKLGNGTIYQLTKMEGHILVGLSSVKLADKLIEEGLNIEDVTLRAFPLRKKAERIVLGNVFFFVEDSDLVTALRPYGQVTSIIQKMMQLEDSCWADARREAFITLRDGVKISHIPARLDVKSKGVVTHFYVTYGIKCSLCHKQGHKGANCPRKTGVQEDKLVLPVKTPAVRTQGWTKPLSTSNTMPLQHLHLLTTDPNRPHLLLLWRQPHLYQGHPMLSRKTLPSKKKARAGVEASLIQAHALQQLRSLNTSCGIVCTHQADPSTPSSPAAPSLGANFPVRPYETPTPELPVPAPSTSQLPSRPEPSSTNTEPPAEDIQAMTESSIQSATPADQGISLSLSQAIQEREPLEQFFKQLKAYSTLAPLYGFKVDYEDVVLTKALEEMLGRGAVFQLMKMSGQVLVGLESTEKAERLSEEGLTIGNTLLKVFPYRKRAEKIALRPYRRVVSLTHEVVASGGYTWTTGSRKAFILLNEGLKIHQLPAKLVIVSKGESTPAYITYGVRCSKCHRQGHRRATCPLGINGGRHQDTQQGSVSKPPSSKPYNNSAPTAAESSAPIKQTPSRFSSPAAPSSGANIPVRPQETPTPEPPVPAPSTSELPSRPMSSLTITEPTAAPATPMTQIQLPSQEKELEVEKVETIFTQLNDESFLRPLYEEIYRDDLMYAVLYRPERKDVLEILSPEHKKILCELLNIAIEHVADKNCTISKGLSTLRAACST